MKIFSYVSSRRDDSNTSSVVEYMVKKFEEKTYIEWNSYSPKNLKLSSCIGCCKCFNEGKCSLDSKDGFDFIKKQMHESDIIFLGSPVYSAMVNCDMKAFIDRLSYYLHTMQFAGKIFVIVLSASGNSLIETNNYFKRIVESWGGFVYKSVLFTVDAPNMLNSPDLYRNISSYCDEIYRYASGEIKKYTSDYQEKYFLNLKRTYSIPIDNAERLYWEKSGMLKMECFQQYIDGL